jgi:hypothetical protein
MELEWVSQGALYLLPVLRAAPYSIIGIHHGDLTPQFRLVTPRNSRQQIQSVVWGRGRATNILYATSGPEDFDQYTGYHKAFDIEHKKDVAFGVNSGGECLDVTPTGECMYI